MEFWHGRYQRVSKHKPVNKTEIPAVAIDRSSTGKRPGVGQQAAYGEAEVQPLSRMRRAVASRLTEAWQAPAFQLTRSIEMTRAKESVARQRELNTSVRITMTDLLLKVCAQGLMKHPDINVQWTDEALLAFESANIGLAIAAPHGLVVPVIRQVEQLTLPQVSSVRLDLAERARARSLRVEELEGGTFTITNLGMYGIEQFIAVLNPPQACILAVGAIVDTVVARNSEVVVRPMMTVTLTCDHRAVDGAAAAAFLGTVTSLLEAPE